MRVPARGLRRAMAASGLVAVVVAGLVVTTTDGPVVGVSALPGATADPTGPTGGPGGDGGLNGGQFQPPQMPSPPGGYNGGSYPQPGQSDYGVDINSPAAQAPEYSQAPQYPQQAGPQQQQPAHGQQPPNYDAPLQQQPSAAQQPSAPQTADPQQPQQSDNTQEPSQQQDSQQLNQKQQQCQAAMSQLRNTVSTVPAIVGGGGRGLILGSAHPAAVGPWKLDPAPTLPTPPCADCGEATQKQMQDQINDLQRQLNERDEADRERDCKLSGNYAACPELQRKEIPDHCEGSASNPTPICYLNPLDTKYCQPGEAAWLAYNYWTELPMSWSFDTPKKLWDYFSKPCDYTKKCLEGAP